MKLGEKSFSRAFSINYAKNKAKLSARVADNPVLHPSLLAAFSLFLGIFAGTYVIPNNATFANTKIDAPASETSNKHSEYLTEKSGVEKTEEKTITNRGQGVSYSRASTGGTSTNYNAGAGLSIPSLGIATSVSASNLSGQELSVPSSTVSYYGSLLMGHSSGVFASLPGARTGQEIIYNGRSYTIDNVRINLPVSSDRKKVGNYSMAVLTGLGANRIVLMTCAGSYQPGFGYTGRTLVFATLN